MANPSGDPALQRKKDYSAHCDTCKTLLLVGANWYHKPGSETDLCYSHWVDVPENEQASFVSIYEVSKLGKDRMSYKVGNHHRDGAPETRGREPRTWRFPLSPRSPRSSPRVRNSEEPRSPAKTIVAAPQYAQQDEVAREAKQEAEKLQNKILELKAQLEETQAQSQGAAASGAASWQKADPPVAAAAQEAAFGSEALEAKEEVLRKEQEEEKEAKLLRAQEEADRQEQVSTFRRCWQALEEKYTKAEETACVAKSRTVALAKDPRFQTVALSGGSGAVVMGTLGGSAGCAVGVASGAVVGMVPALLTFGLSIPAGAIICGTAGTCTGATVGGTAGLLAGMAAGNTVHLHRAEIKDGFLHVQAKVSDTMVYMKLRISSTAGATKARALEISEPLRTRASVVSTATQAKAGEAKEAVVKLAQVAKERVVEVASDRKVQVTAASAAAGGVALGAGGGLAGGVAGATVGLVPALFTFGLSIPAGFVLGGSAGMLVGGSVGTAAGGAAGYGAYTHSSDIKAMTGKASSKASMYAERVKEHATSVRAKIIGGGTGSTA